MSSSSPNPLKIHDPNPPSETHQDQEEEGEGECPFCAYMKAGECKETFIEWEKCVDEGEKNKEDIVKKCFEVTDLLKKCMEANPDHYAPILEAQKEAEKIVIHELDREKEKEAAAVVGNPEKLSERS